jgi:hypothetical protein
MNVPHERQWLARARAISHYADLFWRSSRDKIEYLRDFNLSAGSSDLRWVEQHWPQRNEFEQSMFVSIAAMLAKDVPHDAGPLAQADERFPLVLHVHLNAMSDDDLRDWCAEDVERMMAAADGSDRDNPERQFITWCEGLLAEMLAHITAE